MRWSSIASKIYCASFYIILRMWIYNFNLIRNLRRCAIIAGWAKVINAILENSIEIEIIVISYNRAQLSLICHLFVHILIIHIPIFVIFK